MKPISENISPRKILFVGEKPGPDEVRRQRPLVGPSGMEFDRMLAEAGLQRSDAAITNVAHEEIGGSPFYKAQEAKMLGREKVLGKYPVYGIIRGLDMLPKIVEQVQPNIIVPLGDIALWAFLGQSGITKWRGSVLEINYYGKNYKVLPTFNPAAILKQWPWRWIMVQDLRRVAAEKDFPEVRRRGAEKHVRPTIDDALQLLDSIKGKTVAADIETRAGQISCVGFAPSKEFGFCIPFMSIEHDYGYWSYEEELQVTLKMKEVLTHPDTKTIWHNGLYDCQYFAKQWGYLPNPSHDTMLMHHVAFPGMQKSLYFISSLYCDYYVYWKDDGKEWDPRIHNEEQHWLYNVDDCLYTFECWEVLTKTLKYFNLTEQYNFQMRLFRPVLKMMLRGVNIDQRFKNWLNGVLMRQMQSRAEFLEKSVGHELNPDNHDQIKRLLYKDFRVPVIKDKKTGQPTTNDEALDKIKEKQPFLRPLCQTLQESRSLRVFRSTFAEAPLSEDGRMRSSINICGTETLRFSMSKDAFGSGANLQTIPKGAELPKFLKNITDNTQVEVDLDMMMARHPKYGEVALDEADPDGVVATVRKWVKDDEKGAA